VRSEASMAAASVLFQLMQTFCNAAAARIISFCVRNHFVSAEHRSERGQRGTIAGLQNIYLNSRFA
ncbi:hypothetical protein, partial [Desulfofundulus thermocisternus]|uniref:hypothetical protein n=1 Tax=Desulfofundulus thermocisternus TaxID=42471 RepID=UPI00217E1E84